MGIAGEGNAQSLELLREVDRTGMPTRIQRVVYEVRNGLLSRGFSQWQAAATGQYGAGQCGRCADLAAAARAGARDSFSRLGRQRYRCGDGAGQWGIDGRHLARDAQSGWHAATGAWRRTARAVDCKGCRRCRRGRQPVGALLATQGGVVGPADQQPQDARSQTLDRRAAAREEQRQAQQASDMTIGFVNGIEFTLVRDGQRYLASFSVKD